MNAFSKVPNPTSTLDWISYAVSVIGHIRKVNEDSFLDFREQGLWVVADGMGGHSFGDRASQIIIEKLLDFESKQEMDNSVQDLRERFYSANRACRSLDQGQTCGSTVAAMHTQGESCSFLWAGDSRIYRLRGGELEQLTVDHSLVQELCNLGELTPEEAENHPASNIITRGVGVHEILRLDVQSTLAEPGDRYLLCSDGLFKDVRREEIRHRLAIPSAEEALRELIKHALKRGGTDNVTAIIVQAGYGRKEKIRSFGLDI